MGRRAVVLIGILSGLLCSTVVLRGAAAPIVQLALQGSDIPAATAKPLIAPRLLDSDSLEPLRVRGLEGAHYAYLLWAREISRTSKDDPLWSLAGEVYRTPDEAGAKRLFTLGKQTGIGFESTGTAFGGQRKNLDLPAYGDEQFACAASHPTYGVAAMVFVRKGAIVWSLVVEPRKFDFKPTEAQMVELLKTYAAKQMARVAAG